MNVVPLGPVVLSIAGLLLLAGLVTAFAINGWLHRRGRTSAETALWWLFIAGVVIARGVFVLRWWPEYASRPLAIFDPRDGGFVPWVGVLAVLVGAAWLGWRRQTLRVPLAWAVLGGMLVWGFGGLVVRQLSATTHPQLPALVLRDLDDSPHSLQGLRGRPLVINLWATWCGPCREEMPVLAQAQQAQTKVRFVFANEGEAPAKIRAFLAQTGLHLDGVLVDPFSRLSQEFGVRGYPTTLFFDAQGTLRDIHTGVLSHATLAAALQRVTPPTDRTVSSTYGVPR
ncbi:MAG: TlpA family protein disulfide reductase [Proteobacteria bacterium]|nr:TlpA family protein disulfide reductase [Pseudomonadota bacterium]